jgi:hypothetical protein
MHGPQLIERILQIKLQIEHAPPEECAALYAELDAQIAHLELIAKSTRARIVAVANQRFPAYVKLHCGK